MAMHPGKNAPIPLETIPEGEHFDGNVEAYYAGGQLSGVCLQMNPSTYYTHPLIDTIFRPLMSENLQIPMRAWRKGEVIHLQQRDGLDLFGPVFKSGMDKDEIAKLQLAT